MTFTASSRDVPSKSVDTSVPGRVQDLFATVYPTLTAPAVARGIVAKNGPVTVSIRDTTGRVIADLPLAFAGAEITFQFVEITALTGPVVVIA